MTWAAVLDVLMALCAMAMISGGGGLLAIAVYSGAVRVRAWWRLLRVALTDPPYSGRHAEARARRGRWARWWQRAQGSRGRLWEEALRTGRRPYVSVISGQFRLAVWHPAQGEVLGRDRYVSEAAARAALAGLGRSPRSEQVVRREDRSFVFGGVLGFSDPAEGS